MSSSSFQDVTCDTRVSRPIALDVPLLSGVGFTTITGTSPASALKWATRIFRGRRLIGSQRLKGQRKAMPENEIGLAAEAALDRELGAK